MNYQDEIDHIVTHEKRNEFIRDLTSDSKRKYTGTVPVC